MQTKAELLRMSLLHRNLGGPRPMKIMGHQAVGSVEKSHDDMKMMIEKFFGGEAVSITRALRTTLGSIKAKKLLSQIFKVVYHSMTNCVHTITCNTLWTSYKNMK